jgi:hypothetical protein
MLAQWLSRNLAAQLPQGRWTLLCLLLEFLAQVCLLNLTLDHMLDMRSVVCITHEQCLHSSNACRYKSIAIEFWLALAL